MRRILQFIIFISLFLSLSILFNIYIFYHMSFMLRLPHNIWFWLLLIFSSASFFIAMFLESIFDNIISRFIVIVSSIWLGGLFIILFILFGYDILRFFIPIHPYTAGPVIIFLVIIFVSAGIINAQFIRIRKIRIQSYKLPKELKIVHLSDLHLGAIHGSGYLRRIVRKVSALKPDLVLITGDLVDGPQHYSNDSFAPLNELDAPIFFTTGNHEYYAGLDEVMDIIKNTKIKPLRNQKIDINGIQLIGVDNGGGRNYIDEILKNIPMDQNKFKILMYHQPVPIETINKYGVDLMLTGHTHGGQFFMFVLFARLIWKRINGLYKYRNTYLFASPGTGTWGPPIRLGTNSEIIMLSSVN